MNTSNAILRHVYTRDDNQYIDLENCRLDFSQTYRFLGFTASGNVKLGEIMHRNPETVKNRIGKIEYEDIETKTVKEQKMPELDYNTTGAASCKYSNEYLTTIIELMDVSSESTRITLKKDFPATFENEHFKVILAPRVDND